MAALAQKLGFQTLQIKEILKQSPDRQIARATLLKARKLDRYHYDMHTSSPPGEPLPRTSTDEGSDVSEPIRMDIFESSDLEDLEPQPGVHTSFAPGEPSSRTSIGEGCDVSDRATIDISESSDLGDPEPQPGAHTSSPPREPSSPTSTGEGSDVNEPIRMDTFESSDSEDLGPQAGVQSDVGMKERERTESDEDELGCEEQKRRE
ncbi:hypothetical protein KXW11_006759 [Aspergillus fumigatus]|nr:hypothetical protein KXW11_006759 [Aspergillus fumigatus]